MALLRSLTALICSLSLLAPFLAQPASESLALAEGMSAEVASACGRFGLPHVSAPDPLPDL